jgi:serine/threonine protein kinase
VIARPDIALPQGYALNEYRIESTLGVGGFGLTYLASDTNLNLKVAIKEFLPSEFALRGADQSVNPRSDSSVETFNWGLARFLDESRALATFRHPNIVRVMRFFEANRTAYMVMEFVAGQPLGEWIWPRRPPPEKVILALADPLLDGLDVVHRAKYLHRDIKPNNIFIREDGSPVLIDFGSARMASEDTDITSIVTPGYAPFEQYQRQGNQGPWSDLYAFGAVLYWMVTGTKPVESLGRIRADDMVPAAKVGDRSRYSSQLLDAIDWALSPLEQARPQSVAAFRDVLRRITPTSASEDLTVIGAAGRAADGVSGRSGSTFTTSMDGDTVKRIETELATHLGPIASVVVRTAASKATTIARLVELVSAEITDDKARTALVKKFTVAEHSSPTSSPTGMHTGMSGSQTSSAPQRFDAATLAAAEAALATYLGAVARVLVRRAAAKARDETELFRLLSEQIDDQDQRKAFVRKVLSVSGKR